MDAYVSITAAEWGNDVEDLRHVVTLGDLIEMIEDTGAPLETPIVVERMDPILGTFFARPRLEYYDPEDDLDW